MKVFNVNGLWSPRFKFSQGQVQGQWGVEDIPHPANTSFMNTDPTHCPTSNIEDISTPTPSIVPRAMWCRRYFPPHQPVLHEPIHPLQTSCLKPAVYIPLQSLWSNQFQDVVTSYCADYRTPQHNRQRHPIGFNNKLASYSRKWVDRLGLPGTQRIRDCWS